MEDCEEQFFFNNIEILEQPKRIKLDRTPEEFKKPPKPQIKHRSKEELDTIFEFYPKEEGETGFMKSFAPTDFESIKHALEKYGFAVVDDIVEPNQCDKTVEEFFFDVNRRAEYFQKEIVDPSKPQTWENENFTTREKNKFLTNAPALTPNAFKNRCNPKIFNIYAKIFQREDLWCNIDNWGLFRGTKDLTFIDEEGNKTIQDRDDWRWELKLHWDQNPWLLEKWSKNGDYDLYQGFIALVDCPEEVGGFIGVPGSHKFLSTWVSERETPTESDKSVRLPPNDPMQNYKQKVTMKKGQMLIWNSRTAHCNFSNHSPNMRIQQFLRFMPAIPMSELKDKYSPGVIMSKYRGDYFTDWKLPYLTSDFERRLFGLKEYPQNGIKF